MERVTLKRLENAVGEWWILRAHKTRVRCTLQYSPLVSREEKRIFLVCGPGRCVEVHETVAGVAVAAAGEETSWSR